MARQRASFALTRLSSSELDDTSSSSSSAESNINVGGARKTRSGSVESSAPAHSTPPTSLPGESVCDAASDKQAMDIQGPVPSEEGDGISRRSSRRRSAPATSTGSNVSEVRRVSSVRTIQKSESRSFSGQTLVNDAGGEADAQAPSADTPRRKLLDDGVKTLDMEWDINAVNAEADEPSKSPPRPKSRRSLLQLDRIAGALGNAAKKVLGKRSRDEAESSADAGRRQSSRISAIPVVQEKVIKKQKQNQPPPREVAERPSTMTRVASSLSMPSLSTTFSLSKQPKLRERPVKKYQTQGLYVGQSAEDYDPETKKPKKRKSTGRPTSSASAAAPPARQPIMPLPMFDYLERERPFVIPYGVFAPQWRERGTEKPKDWATLNRNRFVGTAKEEWRTFKLPTSLCTCKTECGSDCWNLAMGVECDSNNCNVGPGCNNRDFAELSTRMARASKYDKKSMTYLYNAGVEVVKTKSRGFGVRACREFGPNEIITEYTGEIITQAEGYRRVKEDYAGKSDYYQMEFDQGMILDATRGSLARFVNHSCDPNCEMVKRTVAGQPRMALFAGDKGIMTGEELTYDYNFDPYSTTNVQACLCGAANCRLFLGPKPAGEKKPSSKKEQLAMAMSLNRTATGAGKRKVGELFDDTRSMEIEIPKELVKKRKVPQMSKGWAYIDEDMERQRIEEAEKDKELKRLQREGLLTDVKVSRPKYPSRSSVAAAASVSVGRKVVEKVKTMTSTKAKGKKKDVDDDEPKLHKPSMMNRVSGSIKRKMNPVTEAAAEKRKSTMSTTSSFRQSTLSFAPRNVSGASGEALLSRTESNTSVTELAVKRSSVMSRASSRSKRNSTVRIVEEGDD